MNKVAFLRTIYYFATIIGSASFILLGLIFLPKIMVALGVLILFGGLFKAVYNINVSELERDRLYKKLYGSEK